jgi:hypothetical protein
MGDRQAIRPALASDIKPLRAGTSALQAYRDFIKVNLF